MIIRIQANGGSFRGAGLYYLHDKSADPTLDKHLKPKTDERVWFSETRNCLSIDPGRALEEMWRTAEDQAYLKMQAGVKRGGRVCEDPTKTLSMSWHKDDKPTPEHMVEAADALLEHMGWDTHQAVYVGHNDTEHRHIHIILNRVNPENGRTLDDFREQKRAQSWALRYEREQEQVRCEQREINAAREAGRSSQRQKDAVQSNEHSAGMTHEIAATRAPIEIPSLARPANDHLPHNVIMLSRPHEREFADQEQLRNVDADLRAEQAAEQKSELKDRQRTEREAFFKDGAKLFKATRHAVYDDVRKEYKAEWRQFYKECDAAQKSAEASSQTALGRAFHFARSGQWEAARDAFNELDSVRDAVAKELSERKADLKARQTDDLRERQRDACDALRDVRDVQYQELLQRQRDERSAFNAGQALQSLGVGVDRIADQASPEGIANENRTAGVADVPQQAKGRDVEDAHNLAVPVQQQAGETTEPLFRPLDQVLQLQAGGFIELPRIEMSKSETIAPARGVSDLAAASVGSVASYLADQLGELFAPTPPEVREAQAKAEVKQASERAVQQPEHDDKAAAYARIIDSAVRLAEAERAQQGDAYWKERDRGKGFERDQ